MIKSLIKKTSTLLPHVTLSLGLILGGQVFAADKPSDGGEILRQIERDLEKINPPRTPPKIEEEKTYGDDVELIEFGKIFKLIKGSIQSSKVIEDEDGIILVTGAKEFKKIKKITDYHILSGENLFISSSGNGDKVPIKFYNNDCYYSCLMSLCKLNEDSQDKVNIKYIYYLLKDKQEYIEKNYQKGCANKSLDIENFNKMKIPIPPLEKQNEIVEYLDYNNDIIKNLEKEIEFTKNKCNDFFKQIL